MPEYTGRPYPRTCICHVWRVARSTVYTSTIPRQDPTRPSGKRGPKTPISDARPLEAIRAVLAACPSYGEGYRKVRARLAQRGLAVCGKWVLRLMRAHGLLAPRSPGASPGDPAHPGTIVTARPDVMWGTDATRFYSPSTVGAGSSV